MQNPSRHALTLLALLATGLGTSAVQAAEKSAVSPEIVSSPSTSTVNLQAAPVSEPIRVNVATPAKAEPEPSINLQSRQSNNSTSLTIPADTEPPAINLQSRRSRNSALNVPLANPQPTVNLQARSTNKAFKINSTSEAQLDVVLESRTSGCRAVVSSSVSQWDNACAPTSARNTYDNRSSSGYRAYYDGPGFTAEIRQLSPRELKAMSIPGNGDKRMIFPLAIPALISSSFGYRVHPITKTVRFHQGTDIAAAEGTPVLAAYSGTIEVAGWLGGLGLAVVISHDNTHETRYGHLSQVFVKPGQKVKQGTPIGLVGTTGFSTGPHLHFELWQKIGGEWIATDPTGQLFLALEQLNRYLAQAIK